MNLFRDSKPKDSAVCCSHEELKESQHCYRTPRRTELANERSVTRVTREGQAAKAASVCLEEL